MNVVRIKPPSGAQGLPPLPPWPSPGAFFHSIPSRTPASAWGSSPSSRTPGFAAEGSVAPSVRSRGTAAGRQAPPPSSSPPGRPRWLVGRHVGEPSSCRLARLGSLRSGCAIWPCSQCWFRSQAALCAPCGFRVLRLVMQATCVWCLCSVSRLAESFNVRGLIGEP